jgi:hypothetical protein
MTVSPELWAGIIGLFMPIIVSFIKRPDWDPRLSFGLSLLVSILVGAGTAFVSGSLLLKPETALVDIIAAFTASQVVYKSWFEYTGANKSLSGTADED